jgi:hypothetical protein
MARRDMQAWIVAAVLNLVWGGAGYLFVGRRDKALKFGALSLAGWCIGLGWWVHLGTCLHAAAQAAAAADAGYVDTEEGPVWPVASEEAGGRWRQRNRKMLLWLVPLLVLLGTGWLIAMCASLVGAGVFEAIELWEKIEPWLP